MVAAAAAVLWTAALVSQSALPAAATQPPPTGLILGRVVDGSSGRPVAGAIVTLGAGALPSVGPAALPRALTNAAGQFVFRKLPKGSYRLNVTRAGYEDGSYGQRRPGGVASAIVLDEGQRIGDAVISLWKFASISGTVVDEAGEPLVGVQVRAFLRRFAAGRQRVMPSQFGTTDDRGIYRIASLVPGDYLVAFVWRETSLPMSVADVLNNPATVNDPKVASLRRERMTATGGLGGSSDVAVSGHIVRELSLFAATPPPSTDTTAVFVYPTQFYPGVANAARARAITLASGEAREGIDFALHPVKTARISGTVLGPEGPVPNVTVRLVPATDETVTELDTSTTITGAGGEFTLIGVPAGQYLLRVLRIPEPDRQASVPVTTQVQIGSSMVMSVGSTAGNAPPPPVPDDPTLAATLPLAVNDTDVTDVLVTLQRGPRVTGHYEFDGSAQRPDGTALTRMMVTLQPASGMPMTLPFGSPPFGHADETGAFKTYGMAPGKYILRVTEPPGWTFRSAMVEGRDISDAPLELGSKDVNTVVVTFTDRPTSLSGIVRDASGNADSAALVVVFPAETDRWTDFGITPRRLRSLRADRNGKYSVTGLPPGEYYVAAIHEDTIPQWQDPQVLEELARSASQVRLSEGDARAQDLKSTGGGR